MSLSTTKGAYSRIAGALAITLLGFMSAQGLAQAEKAAQAEPKIIKTHAFASHGEPKYGPDFEHFDYVNPNAPKGGQLIRWMIGSYDNFNRYAQRGSPAVASDELNDSLMVASSDELATNYALIAESMEYPEDFSWVIFNINPKARDTSGKPLTAEDVAFSFNKFMTQGVPQFRSYFKNVTEAEVLSEHRVKFHFEQPSRDDVAALTQLSVLPKHFWEDRDFSEPLDAPPIGSGPYRIKEYKMGQSLTYERLDDYWAQDLPSRKGTLNFDTVRYDYYRDNTVALEAFKAGEYDFRTESEAKLWAESYDFPALKRGAVVKEELEHEIPQPLSGFIFNTQHELFQDRRVREALNYALDFQWLNQNLFYNQYQRSDSYFQNTPYRATGKPSEAELEILKPLAEQLPEEVFGEVWTPPVTDGSGNIRPQLRKAMELLKEAGWELKNRKLVHSETGMPFEFELLFYSSATERHALPYKRNLERLGIDMQLRQMEPSQFIQRVHEHDYAMVDWRFNANPYPDSTMKIAWHSEYIDSTYNSANVQDPVIDSMIGGIVAHQRDEGALLTYGHAFDRVARWHFYLVPHWHSNKFRIAYWNKFSRPETRPKYALGLETWWYDESKARALKK